MSLISLLLVKHLPFCLAEKNTSTSASTLAKLDFFAHGHSANFSVGPDLEVALTLKSGLDGGSGHRGTNENARCIGNVCSIYHKSEKFVEGFFIVAPSSSTAILKQR